MKKQQNNFLKRTRIIAFAAILFAILLSYTDVFAQHELSQYSKETKKVQKTESIIREGKIDLKKIDKNKDGKIFQDPMDWNVISDSAGKCPICKMKLKEVSIKEAKENLKKNGFKVK